MTTTPNKDDFFLYQINFNRKKFPEICEALENAKKSPNGIAWYLRDLIQKDIDAKKGLITPQSQVYQTPVKEEPKPDPEPKYKDNPNPVKEEPIKEDPIKEEPIDPIEEDNTGGFL